MALNDLVLRAFGSGEIAPELYARADLAQYQAGARTIRNFQVQRQGGVCNRAGTKFVAEAKTTGKTFLFAFHFPAADASYLIEAGDSYFRFHHNGAPVTVSGVVAWSGATAYVVGDLASAAGVNYYAIQAGTNHAVSDTAYWYPLTGTIYEIPHPYPAGAFEDPAPLCWAQSGSLITLTHGNYAPKELVYGGSGTAWVLRAITTAPAIAAPTALVLTGTVVGAEVRSYVATAVLPETHEESLASTATALTANKAMPTPAAPINIAFTPASGALEHRVYCDVLGNSVYGYIGTTVAASFNDTGIAPDFLETPPQARVLFTTTNNYPVVSVVHQQRRIFGGTGTDREKVYASRTGQRSNFSLHSPLQDDDAVTWKLASNRLQPVMHLVGMSDLLVLTDQGAWLVHGDADGVLTPTGQNLEQIGYIGSSFLPPVVVGASIVYVQARKAYVRELTLASQPQAGYGGRDLTALAVHLFKGHTIQSMDYAYNPDSIVWCVRDDGTLLGCTYLRAEEVLAWHRHDTLHGLFERVCVLAENTEDAVYVVVKRTIDGSTVRYIERLAAREDATIALSFFLDCGITKNSASSVAVPGLSHLEGETVFALADGLVQGPFTVVSGAITLTTAAATVHVGLLITAQLETLALDVGGTSIRGRRKRVQGITALVTGAVRGFYAGPDASHLIRTRPEAWQSATGIEAGAFETNLTAAFTSEGRTVIQHTDPTPLTILGLIPQFEIGG